MNIAPATWFYVQQMGQEAGPYDFAALRTMLVSGAIRHDSMVRTRESNQWFPATQVPGLFSDKEWLIALLLAIFLGALGVDRFYIGHVGIGILKLVVSIVTCGVGGAIWQIVDIILIAMRKVTDANGLPLR